MNTAAARIPAAAVGAWHADDAVSAQEMYTRWARRLATFLSSGRKLLNLTLERYSRPYSIRE